ncbi:MerR family transcriptional regulator [Thalassobacillus hwangdonensis]|uniref:MerR family transcriptional regulator n=1 Tax=Thalassobacillus hwangdonensis TaxID=546108 RepID=A0ABW3L1C6_9BACI
MYKIKEVAELAGVSVRTLHHYDRISLLKPAIVGVNGYRFYDDANLSRLQQILFYKEMGFSLQEIGGILDDPTFDFKKALEKHKVILEAKMHRLERIIRSVDQTIDAMEGGTTMSKEEKLEPFDMSEIEAHQKKYADEVKERWGHTDPYKESMQKTASYDADDWKQIQEDMNQLYKGIADRMDEGPEDTEVQRLVGEYRNHITGNFYECTPEIFRGLGDMYVNDPRFTKNIDKVKPGLAEFLRDAIQVYCDNLEQSR